MNTHFEDKTILWELDSCTYIIMFTFIMITFLCTVGTLKIFRLTLS